MLETTSKINCAASGFAVGLFGFLPSLLVGIAILFGLSELFNFDMANATSTVLSFVFGFLAAGLLGWYFYWRMLLPHEDIQRKQKVIIYWVSFIIAIGLIIWLFFTKKPTLGF